MANSKDDVIRTALALPEAERAGVIVALIDSLDTSLEAGAAEAWLSEILRRAEELDSLAVQSIPWDVVKQRLSRVSRG